MREVVASGALVVMMLDVMGIVMGIWVRYIYRHDMDVVVGGNMMDEDIG